jgi:hypothetical protein
MRCFILIATVLTSFMLSVAVAKKSSIRNASQANKQAKTKPTYFKEYRSVFKPKRLRACVNIKVTPANGVKCTPSSKSDWYSCLLGEQQCKASSAVALPGLGGFTGANFTGLTHPTTKCDCKDSIWTCYDWNICSVANGGVASQPPNPTIPTTEDDPDPNNNPSCPALMPKSKDTAPVGLKTGASCGYGTNCCCGICEARTVCVNNQGVFHCLSFAVKCPTKCTDGQPTPAPRVTTLAPAKAVVQTCGSLGDAPCPAGQTCFDPDPTDKCNPDVDCRGICVASTDTTTSLVVDAPDTNNNPLCPATKPISKDVCPAGIPTGFGPDAHCGYGEVCCCGDCKSKTSCLCNRGIFQCLTFLNKCPDVCPPTNV